MPTFQELKNRVEEASNRLTIVQFLIEHIDTNFRANAGAPPKNHLLTANKIPVPQEAFESLIAQVLLPISTELGEEIQHVLNTDMTPPVAQAPVVEVTPAEVPVPVPKQKRKYTKKQPKAADEGSNE